MSNVPPVSYQSAPPPVRRCSDKRLSTTLACLATSLLLPAAAQAADLTTEDTRTNWQTRVSLQAFHAIGPGGQQRAQWRWQQSLSWQGQAGWQAMAELDALADSEGLAHGSQGWGTRSTHASALSLGRAYAQYQQESTSGVWQWRLGRQTFDWATTDTVSPLDVLNPRDWSDLSRPRKRPVPALSVQWSHPAQGLSAQVVATPGGQALLPQGAWRDALAPGIQLGETRSPGSQLAARLTGQTGEADWSAVLYRGPALSPSATVQVQPTGATVQPFHDTVSLWGMGVTLPVAPGSLWRAEWARQQQAMGDDFDTLVLSLDHERNGVLNSADTLYLLAQVQLERTNRRGQPDPQDWWDMRRVFRHHLMARVHYQPANPTWLWTLESTLHPGKRERYVRLAVRQQLDTTCELTWGMVGVHGVPGSFWGAHRQGRHAFVQLSWTH